MYSGSYVCMYVCMYIYACVYVCARIRVTIPEVSIATNWLCTYMYLHNINVVLTLVATNSYIKTVTV